MMILSFRGLIKARARARLRRVMRGYRNLRADGCLEQISKIKEILTNTPVLLNTKPCGNRWGLEANAFELSVRQFLLVRLVGTGLGPALLESAGEPGRPTVCALPRAWREALRGHGYNISERKSALLWKVFVALHLLHGAFTILKLACKNFAASGGRTAKPLGSHVFFDTLIEGNLPAVDKGAASHDIVSWYLQWPGGAENLDSLCHTVTTATDRTAVCGASIVSIASPLVPLTNIRSSVQFLSWGAIALIAAWSDAFFFKRWWCAVMLGEAAKATLIRLQVPGLLAHDYLFHNSNWIYRPLWTYEAERKGSRIIFYFYSTNAEKFKRASAYPSISFGWEAMTWPHYLVWDAYQREFVQRAVGLHPRVDVVGPIPFHAGKSLELDLQPNSIAVFDVQPMRDAVYQPLGIDVEYYVPRTANSFLIDIQDAVTSAGQVMVFKRKRDVGSRIHPCYERTIRWLNGNANCMEVDPDIAASALIEKCKAVVSMPFTSTALLGREQGKPSVYYDPHGICRKDDRAAHGIPILSGKAELKQWLSSLSS